MLRRGGGEDKNLGNDGDDNHKSNNSSSTTTTTPSTTKLRGLLKLLKGQICNPNTKRSTDDTVSVFSYDADVLLETHKEFKKRRKRSAE